MPSATAAACWPGWSGAGGAGGGCTCGTGGPIGGRPTSAGTLRSGLQVAAVSGGGHGGRGRGLVGRAGPRWRCSSRRPWRRALGDAAEVEQQRRDGLRHWEQRLERARYEAGPGCPPVSGLCEARRTGWWPGPWSGSWEEALAGGPTAGGGLRPLRPVAATARGRGRARAQITSAGRGSAGSCGGPRRRWRPADRRQIVRLLVDRVVLTVDPGDDRVAVRVEWAGEAVRERTRSIGLCRDIGISNHGLVRSRRAPAGGAARLQGRGRRRSRRSSIGEGFRPPKRASGLQRPGW